MIALLSALAGFFSSALPEFFKLFREGKDRAHEVALLKLQMEHDRARIEAGVQAQQQAAATQLEAIALQRDAAETVALNARVKDSLVGIGWVDALSGTVRPVLTYAFCVIYACVKAAQYYVLMHPALPWQQAPDAATALSALWSQDDMALFTAVIAFWFGQRMIAKSARGR